MRDMLESESLTLDEIQKCREFVQRANDIVNHDVAFEMRKRWQSAEQAKEEQKLHDMHQQAAWQITKQLYLDYKDAITKYRKLMQDEQSKVTVDAIIKVVDDEINEILLGEEH